TPAGLSRPLEGSRYAKALADAHRLRDVAAPSADGYAAFDESERGPPRDSRVADGFGHVLASRCFPDERRPHRARRLDADAARERLCSIRLAGRPTRQQSAGR